MIYAPKLVLDPREDRKKVPAGTFFTSTKILDARRMVPDPPIRCHDAVTNEPIRGVFYYDPNLKLLGRYQPDPRTGRWIDDLTTSTGRVEVWEYRPCVFSVLPVD